MCKCITKNKTVGNKGSKKRLIFKSHFFQLVFFVCRWNILWIMISPVISVFGNTKVMWLQLNKRKINIFNNDLEKHKHVKNNEIMFRRLGEIMTPLSRNGIKHQKCKFKRNVPLTRAPRYILIKSFFLAIGYIYLHDLSHKFVKRLKLLWRGIACQKTVVFYR